MKKQIIFLAFFLIFIQSCCDRSRIDQENSSKEKKEDLVSYSRRSIDEIQNEVLNGNLKSYEELRVVYMDYPPDCILFWAIFVATNYDYPPAYLDVFNSLVNSEVGNIENISKMNPKTRSMAIEYLKTSAKKGNSEAELILKSLEKDYGN